MSEHIVRAASMADVPQVASLLEEVFGEGDEERKLYWERELNWLIAGNREGDNLYSHVVESDNAITGYVSLIGADYLIDGKEVKGSHGINWCVNARCGKGFGTKLLFKISDETTICVLFAGSADAIRLYHRANYEVKSSVTLFHTHISLWGCLGYSSELSFKGNVKRFLLGLHEYTKRVGKKLKACSELEFVPYEDGENIESRPLDSALTNCPSSRKLDWLAAREELNSRAIKVLHKGEAVGPIFLYWGKGSLKHRGRVVSVPNMGRDSRLWEGVLSFIEREFKTLGVTSYSLYVSHPTFLALLHERGFHSIHDRDVWVRDPENVIGNQDMHLMHLEGDHSYRSI